MKLHVTSTSPYARFARISALEHGLVDRIEVIAAQTRQTDSPYYTINPSGRVPCLVLDDGTTMEESYLICQYFDAIGSGPKLVWPAETYDWEYGRLVALSRSFLDGLAVLAREVRRPENEQSPTIVAHEKARAERLADILETKLNTETMTGAFNLAQMILAASVDSGSRYFNWNACENRPRLEAWAARMRQRPSIASTSPFDPL